MLNEIKEAIDNKEIEKAYDLIIYYEKLYIDDDYYWQLKGELCDLIDEYQTALNCYDKAIKLNNFNKCSIERVISIAARINDVNIYEHYNIMLKELEERINYEFKKIIKDDYYDLDNGQIYDAIGSNDYYFKDGMLINRFDCYYLDRLDCNIKDENIIYVPFTKDYVENIKKIVHHGFRHCKVLVVNNGKFEIINICDDILENIESGQYKNTITINVFSASDSNTHAIIKYMPKKYKEKYNLNLIKGIDVFSLENKITVPLKSVMTIGGFSTFLDYPIPSLTYNLEVGHGAMPFKAIGNMAKKNKNFAFTPTQYNNVNKVCVTSQMDMNLQSAATAQSEDKFIITGMPRTDTLLNSNGRCNLEKLLKVNLNNKKVIINMPTFHKHSGSGIVQGDEELQGYVKIKEFDYKRFDKYLENNQMVCVMKVHHAEADIVKSKNISKKLKNIYFIDNNDLENLNMDLYDIINGTDILITDYSSIYCDFIFMNKPVVFTNVDIDKYREDVGILLEPYDFWTAGPKVITQDELENELSKAKNIEYYKEDRERLKPVFFKYLDGGATERIWKYIDNIIDNIR